MKDGKSTVESGEPPGFNQDESFDDSGEDKEEATKNARCDELASLTTNSAIEDGQGTVDFQSVEPLRFAQDESFGESGENEIGFQSVELPEFSQDESFDDSSGDEEEAAKNARRDEFASLTTVMEGGQSTVDFESVENPGFTMHESSDDSEEVEDEDRFRIIQALGLTVYESSDDSDEDEDSDDGSDVDSDSDSSELDEEEAAKIARRKKVLTRCERVANLKQDLKEIETINYALKFNSLLIKAQELEEGPMNKKRNQGSPSKDRSIYYADIFMSLQEVVKQEPIGIVEIICEALRAPTEKSCREKEELLIVLQSKCEEEPPEYLNKVICKVESLVELLASQALYQRTINLKAKDRENHIVSLNEFIIAHGTNKIEDVFQGLFCFTLKAIDLNSIDVKEIVDRMIGANMDMLIKTYCFKSRSFKGVITLQVRSALQSLKELIHDFSIKHFCEETCEKIIYSLDEIIERIERTSTWKVAAPFYKDVSGMNDEDLQGCFCNESIDEFYEAGAREVPREHTWWETYKRVFISESF